MLKTGLDVCGAKPDWVCFRDKSFGGIHEPASSTRSSGRPPSGRRVSREGRERPCEHPCCVEDVARVCEAC